MHHQMPDYVLKATSTVVTMGGTCGTEGRCCNEIAETCLEVVDTQMVRARHGCTATGVSGAVRARVQTDGPDRVRAAAGD